MSTLGEITFNFSEEGMTVEEVAAKQKKVLKNRQRRKRKKAAKARAKNHKCLICETAFCTKCDGCLSGYCRLQPCHGICNRCFATTFPTRASKCGDEDCDQWHFGCTQADCAQRYDICECTKEFVLKSLNHIFEM